MASAKAIFIIGAKRTPFCSYGGSLRELPASHAFAAAAKDAIQAANLDPSYIDNTVVGNVNFLSQCDGGKTPRYCGIYSGVPISSPALGVSKSCGTGLQAIITSAVDILTGNSKISLTGGTELMSALPMLVRNVRFGTALGKPYLLEDHIKNLFPDSYTGLTMQKMAEDLAKKHGVSREEVDEFALQSHLKWKAAQESKVFDQELSSLTVTLKKKDLTIDKDELPRPSLKTEDLNQLPSVLEDGDIITAGNSCLPADGAAALLIASEGSVTSHNLRSLARVAAWSCVGVDPVDTGVAAVTAVRKLMDEQRLKVADIDLFEINETFASQALITAKLLNIDLEKVNVNGGALALGHPVAATGARMATHLVHELGRRNLKRAIAASSCGGGQGIAILLEKM
ncbi:3-ketoacyl-CoA thiolase, mitochondrial-like [Anticarsia gemmatalis]|uniref:3-ketoacyl-CoA thiolase, mitochondrial-like n=1 Tax=Anticarsia gemmatalis TaxID=129554 RepID=UPI003F76F519